MKPDYVLPMPDRFLGALFRRVPGYCWWTFGSAMAVGLVSHLYMFTNKLPNHDDVGHTFTATYGTQSGRWLLPTVLKLDGAFSTPLLIGILGLLFLSVTACLVACILRVRHRFSCTVLAALLVAYPTVSATYSYMFTADGYFLGLMLAALGAYWAIRFPRLGAALGAVSITLSMGIYQSYFPVAAALMVGAMIFDTLDGRKSFRQLILHGVRLAAVLCAGMVLYMLMVKLTTRELGLVDYMGISTMGQIQLSQLPGLVARCYLGYIRFFFTDLVNSQFAILRLPVLLCGAAAAVLLAVLLWKRRLGALRTALVVVLVLLYPLAADLIYVMVAGQGVHLLMIYGSVLLLAAPIALVDYGSADFVSLRLPQQSLCALMSWVILVSMSLAGFTYVVGSNQAYLKMQLSMDQISSYSTRLLSAIEQCEGYEPGLPVVLLGSSSRTDDLNPTPALNALTNGMTGILDMSGMRTSYVYNYFLRYYMGFAGQVYLGTSQEAQTLAALEEVQAMPVYPGSGSVRVVDGYVVVKLYQAAE